MKKLLFLAVGAALMLGIAGCEKATVVSVASCDGFIKSIKNPKDTSKVVYAAIHSVASYDLIASASVVAPDGVSTLQLTDYDKLGYSFYNAPADTTYSATVPPLGVYTYKVTFKDKEVISYTNSISSSILLPPTITGLTKSANADTVYIHWKIVVNAQAYQIKISKGTTSIKYIWPFSDSSSPLKERLTIGIPTSYFSVSQYGAGTYTIGLDGLLYESTDYTYLQSIGSSTVNVTL